MRGKLVIIVIFVVALSAATFAWWWNYQRAVRARAFWGENASTIRFADQVEALQLSSERPQDSILTAIKVGDQVRYVEQATDVSSAPGLLNARASLMVDESFDWSEPPQAPSDMSDWKYGIRFDHEGKTVTLLFDSGSHRMTVAESNQSILFREKTAAGWKGYLQRALTKRSERAGAGQ